MVNKSVNFDNISEGMSDLYDELFCIENVKEFLNEFLLIIWLFLLNKFNLVDCCLLYILLSIVFSFCFFWKICLLLKTINFSSKFL